MYKMIISLDADKLNRDGQYNPMDMETKLDGIFTKKGFSVAVNGSEREYTGTGKETDFSYMGIILNGLRKQSWFTSNVDKWLFCNNEESDDPNDFVEEDLVEYFGISHSK